MKPTNIIEAMKEQRPDDKIIKVLSNKFCIAKCKCMDGSFTKENYYFGLDNGKIYSYPSRPERAQLIPNIERIMWCYEGNASGLKRRWIVKTSDHRKYKQNCRKLAKLL